MSREINKLLVLYDSLFDGLFQDRTDISKQLMSKEAMPTNHRNGKKKKKPNDILYETIP